MGTQQQSSSSSSHGLGSNPTEGEGQTSSKSVGGTSTSNAWQGVAGAQQDTSNSNSSRLTLPDLCRSFLDVPPDRRFHPPFLVAVLWHAARAMEVSRTICKDEFGRNPRSQLIFFFLLFTRCLMGTLDLCLWFIDSSIPFSERSSLVHVIRVHILRVRWVCVVW